MNALARRRLAAMGSITAVTIGLASPVLGYTEDPTFGASGVVQTSFVDLTGTPSGTASVPLALPDGSTVVVGSSGSKIVMARYLRGGCVDNDFGTNGRVAVDPFGSGAGSESVLAAVRQPDGKILVELPGFTVARFTATGALDPTFGDGGMVSYGAVSWDGVSTGGPFVLGAAAVDMALDPDGHIVLAGTLRYGTIYDNGEFNDVTDEHSDLALLRLNSDGSVDSGFGGGTADVALVTRHRDGTTAPTSGSLVRVDADGNDVAGAVTVDGSHNILLAGGGGDTSDLYGYSPSSREMTLVRVGSGGLMDTGFGVVTADLNPDFADYSRGVVVQSDGDIVVGGTSIIQTFSYGSVDAYSAFQVKSDGTFDTSFRGGGRYVSTAFGHGGAETTDLALGPDDSLVFGLTYHDTESPGDNAAFAQLDHAGNYLTSGSTDVGEPIVHTADEGAGVAVASDGGIILAVTSSGKFTAVRYLSQGSSPAIILTVGSTSVDEGNSGTTTAYVDVTLNQAASCAVTFSYHTGGGVATSGSDYVEVSNGTGTIAAGTLTTTLQFTIYGDTTPESTESFDVVADGIVGAATANYSWRGGVTIRNDDFAPTITGRSPANGATNVPVGSVLTATFSQAVTPTITLSTGGRRPKTVAGTTAWDAATQTATFTPARKLSTATAYSWTVSGSNSSGTATGEAWTFTTSASRR